MKNENQKQNIASESWYLAILEDEARAVAQLHNSANPESYARMLVRRIQARCQGQKIHVPRRTVAQRLAMQQDIISKFNGRNADVLAAQYQITRRHVYRIARTLQIEPINSAG